MQHARCLIEVGKYKKARKHALHVQLIQAAAATDPTAMAIAASAAGILFRASGWLQGSDSVSISSADTAAGWWRNQTIAFGLETFLNDGFTLWSGESNALPAHFSDTYRNLRTATLLSGFAGDHSSWRAEYSQLAQVRFAGLSSWRAVEQRLRGSTDRFATGGRRRQRSAMRAEIVTAGPEEAVRHACESVTLLCSTHTTGRSDLELVSSAAEVLGQEQADAYVCELVEILQDQERYAKRVRPTFLIHTYVLETLEALMRNSAVSLTGRRAFIDYFLSRCRPSVTNRSLTG